MFSFSQPACDYSIKQVGRCRDRGTRNHPPTTPAPHVCLDTAVMCADENVHPFGPGLSNLSRWFGRKLWMSTPADLSYSARRMNRNSIDKGENVRLVMSAVLLLLIVFYLHMSNNSRYLSFLFLHVNSLWIIILIHKKHFCVRRRQGKCPGLNTGYIF